MWNYNWHQEIKRIIRDYYKKVYDNKMDNQEELDGFLERHNILRLIQEEIENMNKPIISNETDTVIKNLPTNKSPGSDGFIGEFYQTFRQDLMLILLRFSKILQRAEYFQAHLMRTPSPWCQSQKIYHKKTITEKQNYKPISPMNIDANIINKILAARIQQHIERIVQHDQMGFISGMQVFFSVCRSINVIHHISKLKDKNHMIISTDVEKSFWQN